MVDGPTESAATSDSRTERNRALVAEFLRSVRDGNIDATLLAEDLVQHDPQLPDGRDAYVAWLRTLSYERTHRILAAGDFVLSVTEGRHADGSHTSFFDLFRLESSHADDEATAAIVEHWDTVEPVPPRSEWKNDNGKF
mmetsp:Transcript_13956/g.55725  ORF Transcript_13956/g.55725 Transcript_13956/m.55725 type:complete len:139 (-) Transcript_13956:35-451(-)